MGFEIVKHVSESLWPPSIKEPSSVTNFPTRDAIQAAPFLFRNWLASQRGFPLDADDVHHAQILVAQDVAMKHEITDVLSTKVDPKCDTGIRMGRISIPVWNFDRVEKLP